MSAARFAALFHGNSRSYGVWIPDTTKMVTEKKAVTIKQYSEHLAGGMGLGVVPIMDDGHCWFGAIDIDNHGTNVDIDLAAIATKIVELELPLVACRSKSGGVHVYAFGKEPLKAKSLRTMLSGWAAMLGYSKAEIFPKQDTLGVDASGDRQLGNWINLCYFGGDDTTRYALRPDKKRMPLEPFLEEAESKRMSQEDLSSKIGSGNLDAPPCIQRLMSDGVPDGYRNQALYNITIYRRKANPNTYLDDALDDNNKVLNPPLSLTEARRTIKSASRRDYRYKCGEEPLKSLCDSKVCVTRAHGIEKDEFHDMEAERLLPTFTKLMRYKTDPVRWGIHINGVLVQGITTDELYDFRSFRKRLGERSKTDGGMGLPMLSGRKWDSIIVPLVNEAEDVEAPEDASISGVIAARLEEFLNKASTTVPHGSGSLDGLLRGIPCIHKVAGVEVVVFRAMDFVKYLRTTKSEDLKGPNLWFAMRHHLAIEYARVKVKGKAMNVWYVPYNNSERYKADALEFEQEF